MSARRSSRERGADNGVFPLPHSLGEPEKAAATDARPEYQNWPNIDLCQLT